MQRYELRVSRKNKQTLLLQTRRHRRRLKSVIGLIRAHKRALLTQSSRTAVGSGGGSQLANEGENQYLEFINTVEPRSHGGQGA